MLDINFVRNNLEAVKNGALAKNFKINFDRLLLLDEQRRALQKKVDIARGEKNKATELIPHAAKGEKEKIIARMKEIDTAARADETALTVAHTELAALLDELPNLSAADVKVGKDERENEILREVGQKKSMPFTVKDYLALSKKDEWVDIERAAKVSGSRFGYLKGKGALLELALVRYIMDFLADEGKIKKLLKKLKLEKVLSAKVFTPVIPPVMIRPELMKKSGHLMKGEEAERYFLRDDELILVGTSEQSVVTMHADEILPAKVLPLRYVAFSTCFRREAGSYGKDTKGILRVHQFDKVEMVSFTTPATSASEHELLLGVEEQIMQDLEIPYRVIKMVTGDLGASAAKKYDIEAWMPGQNQYRETHSTSNCTDYQSYKLQIKYQTSNGKNELVHTLNGTAIAIGRMMIALLENGQTKDGSVVLPKKLAKITGFKTM